MGNAQIKVIHIDTGKVWRGGQQQAVYLFECMLRRGFKTWMICQPGSAMEEYCGKKALPYHSINFAHELDFISGIDTARIARMYGADILQLHSGHSVSWGLWAKLFNPKLKLVATRRVDFSIRKNLIASLKYKTSLINRIVCISKKIYDIMILDGINPAKLTIINSGIDLTKFDNHKITTNFRAKWGIPENSVLVGTIAAFAGHKDYPNLLDAAAKILNKNKDVRFMFVGEGELLNNMKEYARELKVDEKVIFTGFQNNVGDCLKAFDIFVLASKKEGLGTSVLDAMASGLPVVATKAGGIPEMIEHTKNGLLVPVHNSDALAQALIELIDDSSLRESLAYNAKKAVSNYDINHTIERYIDLYKELSKYDI
jgi:glycosyltransferase involved in cell wall biosynthesis